MIPGPGEAQIVTLTLVNGPAPTTGLWIGFGLGAAALVAAAFLAWRRAGRAEPVPPRRAARISRGAIACAATWAAMGTADAMLGPLDLLFRTTFELVRMGIVAALLLGTADLLLDLFSPRRTGTWLAIAPPLLASFIVAILEGSGWIEMISADPDPNRPMVAIAAVAAGLVWWSYLPTRDAEVARIFE